MKLIHCGIDGCKFSVSESDFGIVTMSMHFKEQHPEYVANSEPIELPEELLKAKIVLWFCPIRHPREPIRQTVEWITLNSKQMLPVCLDCGRVGDPR